MSLPSEAQERADALQAALEMVTNAYVDALELDACDVIDLAEYICSGNRGVPVDLPLKPSLRDVADANEVTRTPSWLTAIQDEVRRFGPQPTGFRPYYPGRSSG